MLEKRSAQRVLLRMRENPDYERPAGRGDAFERLIPLEPKDRLTSGLLWRVPSIPSTVYGTNAESCQYLLWHVARAARGGSQFFRLLFLGNGSADCVEILHAIGVPLVAAYAVVTGGVSLHVPTCRDTPTPRFCISETALPIVFKFGMWVGAIN